MSSCSLLCSALLVLFVLTVSAAAKPQSPYDIEAPISAYKRFYSWEDAKRAASIESEEGMRSKRKQFYAWAGKRSSGPVHFFEEPSAAPGSVEKRKQFYAWAGRK